MGSYQNWTEPFGPGTWIQQSTPKRAKGSTTNAYNFFGVAGKVQTDNVLLCSSETVIFAQVVSAAYSFRKKNLSWFEFLTWFHFAIISGFM